MTLNDRINALAQLGAYLENPDDALEKIMQRAEAENGWFTITNQKQAINEITQQFLSENKLRDWLKDYTILDTPPKKIIALILAGNIPLVGFHDVLCVFLCGYKSRIKLSDKDSALLPFLLLKLIELDARTKLFFEVSEGPIRDIDAIIATGSNNSSRYFEAYFSKYPNIIRRNRTAVAVLNGEESTEDLTHLRDDVTNYFGLGCRNVSHIMVPNGYDFTHLLDVFHEEKKLVDHNKFKNNFDYASSIMLLNLVPHLVTASALLTENPSFSSPISVLHYSFYNNLAEVNFTLEQKKERIQLVVTNENLIFSPTFKFGEAQSPKLNDYADGVDTMAFLTALFHTTLIS